MLGAVIWFIFIIYLFIMFWLFSFCGWLVEEIACSIGERRLVNRGFLIGPYCPLYGCGVLIMLLISKISDNLFVTFILAMVLCSILEYVTSFIMESLFQVRWWDYSDDPFNLNGRVCLRNSIAFGGLGVIFLKFLKPWFDTLFTSLSYNTLYIITFVIFVITIIDILVSFNAMSKIREIIDKNIDKYKNKDATKDVKKMINIKIPGVNFLHKRLIDTYHLLDKEREHLKETIKKVNEKTKTGYGLFLVFIAIGIIIGLILSLYFKLGSLKIIMPFTLSVCSLIAAIILKVGDR